MSFSLRNRALLRGILAGAVVLVGTACSRSDRTESGGDNSAAVLPDTTSAQPSGGGTATAHSDTSAQSNSPSVETAPPGDKDAAGYRPMERDTTTEASSVPADTTSTEVAGAAALQASTDTSSQAEVDVSAEADVAVAGTADTTGNADRIHPPEDSTEILGEEAVDETADEQVIRPEDRETVAASETPADEVGAAAIGGNVTGTEAVALLSRQGIRCAVVDPEANEAVRWDMSSTPVTLNPCGMGSMVLSSIWMER
jgi:hypothetical protein